MEELQKSYQDYDIDYSLRLVDQFLAANKRDFDAIVLVVANESQPKTSACW